MENKKSQQSVGKLLMIFAAIFIFSTVSVIYVLIGYLDFAIGNDYIVLPLYNISTQLNMSEQFHNASELVTANYQATDLSFIDNMWFFGYFVALVISFLGAYRVRSSNYFSFFSMLTYGIMFILFIAGFFGVLLRFIYFDILQNLFINLAVNAPKLAYYITNYELIFLIHASALLLVTVLDFDFAFNKNRKKKELASLDDELV